MKKGVESSSIKVLGNNELPTRFRSFNRPPVKILDGNTVTSNCNGVTDSVNLKGNSLETQR